MLDKIISGGQTGAGRAAWRAARTYGIPTGGWMAPGFLAEDGPRPEFADEYGATETPTDDALAPTEQNVQDSDGTLCFGETTRLSAHATVGACQRLGKPCLPVSPGASFEPAHVATWIAENRIETLNVAGGAESEEPGIGKRVERFLGAVFEGLGHRGC